MHVQSPEERAAERREIDVQRWLAQPDSLWLTRDVTGRLVIAAGPAALRWDARVAARLARIQDGLRQQEEERARTEQYAREQAARASEQRREMDAAQHEMERLTAPPPPPQPTPEEIAKRQAERDAQAKREACAANVDREVLRSGGGAQIESVTANGTAIEMTLSFGCNRQLVWNLAHDAASRRALLGCGFETIVCEDRIERWWWSLTNPQ